MAIPAARATRSASAGWERLLGRLPFRRLILSAQPVMVLLKRRSTPYPRSERVHALCYVVAQSLALILGHA